MYTRLADYNGFGRYLGHFGQLVGQNVDQVLAIRTDYTPFMTKVEMGQIYNYQGKYQITTPRGPINVNPAPIYASGQEALNKGFGNVYLDPQTGKYMVTGPFGPLMVTNPPAPPPPAPPAPAPAPAPVASTNTLGPQIQQDPGLPPLMVSAPAPEGGSGTALLGVALLIIVPIAVIILKKKKAPATPAVAITKKHKKRR